MNLRNINTRNTLMAQIAIALTSFLVSFVGSAINLALPQIGRDLGMNVVTLSLMVSAYLLPCAVFVALYFVGIYASASRLRR